MTVRELIRNLHVYNPDAEVAFYDHNDNEIELYDINAQFPDDSLGPFVIFWLDIVEENKEHHHSN